MNREEKARRNVRAVSWTYFLFAALALLGIVPFILEGTYSPFTDYGLGVLYMATLVVSGVYLMKLQLYAALAPFAVSLLKTVELVLSDSWRQAGTIVNPQYTGTDQGASQLLVDKFPVATTLGAFFPTIVLLLLGIIALLELKRLRTSS